MESARATLVPVAQSDKGYTRLLRDVSPSAAETDTTVGRRFASRRSGVRFPVSPPRSEALPLDGGGLFHVRSPAKYGNGVHRTPRRTWLPRRLSASLVDAEDTWL